MSAHTPGPWKVQEYLVDRLDREVGSTVSGDLRVRLRVVADDSPMVVADVVAGSAGDARLIAASPEMFAALEAVEAVLDGRQPVDVPGAVMIVRDALAKVRGGR